MLFDFSIHTTKATTECENSGTKVFRFCCISLQGRYTLLGICVTCQDLGGKLIAQLFPDSLFVERHCRTYLALWMCDSSGLADIPFQRCVPPFYTDGMSHSSRLLPSLRAVRFAPYFVGPPTTDHVVRTWCATHSEHEPGVGDADHSLHLP